MRWNRKNVRDQLALASRPGFRQQCSQMRSDGWDADLPFRRVLGRGAPADEGFGQDCFRGREAEPDRRPPDLPRQVRLRIADRDRRETIPIQSPERVDRDMEWQLRGPFEGEKAWLRRVVLGGSVHGQSKPVSVHNITRSEDLKRAYLQWGIARHKFPGRPIHIDDSQF